MQKVSDVYLESRKFFQDSLEDFNPTRSHPQLAGNPGLVKRLSLNYLFLAEEIGCRLFLLADRCARCAYATFLCAYSIVYRTVGKTLSSFDYKSYFSQEFRHLAAESFELIGVVACSILLFPFNRNSSSPPIQNLLRAQIWVEKTAERISGERKHIECIEAAKSKKSTLYEMQRLSSFEQEKIDRWVDKAIDFDEITRQIAPSNRRRIARNYLPEPALSRAKSRLQSLLSFFQDFVPDTIRMHAIGVQQKRFIFLKSLMGDSSSSTPLPDSASNDEQLKYFNDLALKVKQMVEKLHTIHDPDRKVQRELESLDKNLEKAHSNALKSLKENKIYYMITQLNRLSKHFSLVIEKYNKIKSTYSYQDIENPLVFQPEAFIADLLKETSACQTLLNETNQSWNLKQFGDLPLNRQRALAILGLNEKATPQIIAKTYRKLAVIHHPDKGGSNEDFKTYNQAYKYLMPK